MRTVTCAALGLLAFACARGPYPAPGPRRLPPLQASEPDAPDPGDVAGVRALEASCRVRLSGRTAAASVAALDRVREVLGASCDITTVGHDPLHWQLRCRSDALFDSGKYALSARPAACAELGGQRASAWRCVGAVMSKLLRPGADAGAGPLSRLDMAVVGHVDARPLREGSRSHLCTELQQTLDYAPEPAWTEIPEGAPDEERRYGNQQLSWCRAASVANELRTGLLGERAPAGDAGPGGPLSLAVLGMGDSWLSAQPGGACPSTGKTPAQDRDCADARRVDLLMRFTPQAQSYTSSCDRQGDDPATALHCLQQCLERAAVGQTEAGQPAASAPLLTPAATAEHAALPAGWYVKLLADDALTLDLARVCDALGMKRAACGPAP